MDNAAGKIIEDIWASSPFLLLILLLIVGIILGCWFIYVRFGKCLNCEVKEKNKILNERIEGAMSFLDTSVELNQEIKNELFSVRTELNEHKAIMKDIVQMITNTTTIQNEILVRLKIQNRE